MTTLKKTLTTDVKVEQGKTGLRVLGWMVPLWLLQAAKFMTVGVLNTLVDTGLYFALTRWLGLADWPILAKAISYGAGIVNSFCWNRSWTFRSRHNPLGKFVLFVLVKLVGMGINAGMMHVALSVLGLPELLSLAVATGSSLSWNFSVSKWVVFRQ